MCLRSGLPCSLGHLGIAGSLKDSSSVFLSSHQALLSPLVFRVQKVWVGTQAAHTVAPVPVQEGSKVPSSRGRQPGVQCIEVMVV